MDHWLLLILNPMNNHHFKNEIKETNKQLHLLNKNYKFQSLVFYDIKK
jgi:hypothetical protein